MNTGRSITRADALVEERYRRQYARAQEDRQSGAMPSGVQRRADADELWTAFRKHVGIAWTGQRERDFIAGWDAARRSVGADSDLTPRGQSDSSLSSSTSEPE